MLIRVLRARDLEKFLDGQFQISRSYEEPVTQLNPGDITCSRALNGVSSPLTTMRDSLNVGFRRAVKKDNYERVLQPLRGVERAGVPEEMIEGPPAGFDVVRGVLP